MSKAVEMKDLAQEESTARHEAGHAVMAFVLRMPIAYVAIVPGISDEGFEYRGRCTLQPLRLRHRIAFAKPGRREPYFTFEPAPRGKKRQADEIKRNILFFVAGWAAEYALIGREVVLSFGDSSDAPDMRNSKEAAAAIAPDEISKRTLINQMIDLAEELLMLLPYSVAVSRLAAALIEKRTIRCNEARKIIQSGIDEALAHSSADECREFYWSQRSLFDGFPQALWVPLYDLEDHTDGRPIRTVVESISGFGRRLKYKETIKIDRLPSIWVHSFKLRQEAFLMSEPCSGFQIK